MLPSIRLNEYALGLGLRKRLQSACRNYLSNKTFFGIRIFLKFYFENCTNRLIAGSNRTYFCMCLVVTCVVLLLILLLILLFYVLFVCKCVLYYCHRVTTPTAVNKYIISYTV